MFTSSSPGPTESMLLHMPVTTDCWPSTDTLPGPCCCWTCSGGVWPVGDMFIAAAAAAAAAAVAASSLSFLRVAAAASGPLYAPPRALFNPPTATASTIQPGGCNAAWRPLPAPTCGHYRGPARFPVVADRWYRAFGSGRRLRKRR